MTTIPELMKESVQESVKYMEEKFPEVKPGPVIKYIISHYIINMLCS